MQRASEVRALEHLYEQLEQAFEAKDWPRISSIDEQIRSALQLLKQLPLLSDEAVAARQRLQHLHQQVRIGGAEECERLRLLLLRYLEQSEGRSAYMQVDMYQSGRD